MKNTFWCTVTVIFVSLTPTIFFSLLALLLLLVLRVMMMMIGNIMSLWMTSKNCYFLFLFFFYFLQRTKRSKNFYFFIFVQLKMPSYVTLARKCCLSVKNTTRAKFNTLYEFILWGRWYANVWREEAHFMAMKRRKQAEQKKKRDQIRC